MNYEYNMTKAELEAIANAVKSLLNKGFSAKRITEILDVTEYDVAVLKKTFKRTFVLNYKSETRTEIYL